MNYLHYDVFTGEPLLGNQLAVFPDARGLSTAQMQAIHEDELFAPVDIQRQEQLVEQIAAALPEDKRVLIVELADNHARHVWLQQEGAYHVGLAVGHRLRLKT